MTKPRTRSTTASTATTIAKELRARLDADEDDEHAVLRAQVEFWNRLRPILAANDAAVGLEALDTLALAVLAEADELPPLLDRAVVILPHPDAALRGEVPNGYRCGWWVAIGGQALSFPDRAGNRLQHFFWHGVFSATRHTPIPWLDADICGLPKREEGLALPSLRAELLAMAAVVVSDWALEGTKLDHIIGDVLYPTHSSESIPLIIITPGSEPRSVIRHTGARTLRQAGAAVVKVAGAARPFNHSTMVLFQQLFKLVDDNLSQQLNWAGGQCVADVSFLTGSPAASLRSWIRKHSGPPMAVWMPYLELRYLLQWGQGETEAGRGMSFSFPTRNCQV
ncbi:unnamed protein product [Phytophthora fragariaefolia]|uniref:Unnamed protein product n=1 Tax=Phytophthora fragariaefolia TaxID=1490495 RepID=A0A9W6XM29_9STRA|nr:unnamed protein product [Phytophthora fragariaefolia]